MALPTGVAQRKGVYFHIQIKIPAELRPFWAFGAGQITSLTQARYKPADALAKKAGSGRVDVTRLSQRAGSQDLASRSEACAWRRPAR